MLTHNSHIKSQFVKYLVPLFILAACNRPTGKNNESVAAKKLPVKVRTEPIKYQEMPKYLTLTGTIEADKKSHVAANVAGRVIRTAVERGTKVKRGQILAVVDSKAATYQVAAAQAQSAAAQTQVALARQECARADTLFNQEVLPRSEYDRLKSQCTTRLHQATAAQANAGLAGKLAGDAVIRAPLSGIVGERYVNVGEYVQPPSRIASIYAIDRVRVSLSVPEDAVSVVHEGQLVNLKVSAYENREFNAVIRFLSPNLRVNTRDLIIEAVASNLDGALKPGMFAIARLVLGKEEHPTVPVDAVTTDGTVKRIYLAKNGKAFAIVVRTGVVQDGRVAILETLGSDEKVIVAPPLSIQDGSAIQ